MALLWPIRLMILENCLNCLFSRILFSYSKINFRWSFCNIFLCSRLVSSYLFRYWLFGNNLFSSRLFGSRLISSRLFSSRFYGCGLFSSNLYNCRLFGSRLLSCLKINLFGNYFGCSLSNNFGSSLRSSSNRNVERDTSEGVSVFRNYSWSIYNCMVIVRRSSIPKRSSIAVMSSSVGRS